MGFGIWFYDWWSRESLSGLNNVNQRLSAVFIYAISTVNIVLSAVFNDNALATENVLSAVIFIEYEYIFVFDIVNYPYFNSDRLERLCQSGPVRSSLKCIYRNMVWCRVF